MYYTYTMNNLHFEFMKLAGFFGPAKAVVDAAPQVAQAAAKAAPQAGKSLLMDTSFRDVWNGVKDRKVGPIGLGMSFLGGGYAMNEGNKILKDQQMGRMMRVQQEQQANQY